MAPRRPRRPTPISGGARTHPRGGARLVRAAGVRRGGDGDPAGLPRQRGASARLRRPHRSPRRGRRPPCSLRTSPEFACKSLLAAGERRVFELGKAWRNRERGPLHHPEFTLLEWYRAEEPYEALMADCALLLALAAEAAGTTTLRWKDRESDPFLRARAPDPGGGFRPLRRHRPFGHRRRGWLDRS
ncbi:MAG: amino acid--tRNA ligase-related protein [Caulobacteraceae bacterium]